MTTVRLAERDSMVDVSFPYDPDAVAILKDVVHPNDRSYDPPTKVWRINPVMVDVLTNELTRRGHEVLTGDQQPAPRVPTVEDFFAPVDGFDHKAKAAEIIASIPGQHVGRVFRAMARQLYPDLYRRK